MHDAELICEKVSMHDAIRRYHKKGRNNRTTCPLHGGEGNNFCYTDKVFHCWVCGAKGNVLGFVMQYFNIGFYESMKKLDTDFGLGLLDTELTPHQKRVMREEVRRRKSTQLIEKAERERKQKDYLDKCDQYREATKYIQEHRPIGEEPSLEWIQALNTVQYLEYWFEEEQGEGV